MKDVDVLPADKHPVPQTSAQEYGWTTRLLREKNPKFDHARRVLRPRSSRLVGPVKPFELEIRANPDPSCGFPMGAGVRAHKVCRQVL
eukprot:scaffold2009_cov370-Prasinococcus_capsulatus_cf.AAC.12